MKRMSSSSVVNIQYYKSPLGELILGSYQDQLCLCDWRYRKMRSAIDKRIQTILNASYVELASDVVLKGISQLEEYFKGERQIFDLPVKFSGSDFQRKVWMGLMDIEYGQTVSYLQLAEKLGNTQAIRAVASANGANAISIIVPCHRVIGSDGKLVGYAGGLIVKEKLLNLEMRGGREEQLSLFNSH